jgi:hypothetical protein
MMSATEEFSLTSACGETCFPSFAYRDVPLTSSVEADCRRGTPSKWSMCTIYVLVCTGFAYACVFKFGSVQVLYYSLALGLFVWCVFTPPSRNHRIRRESSRSSGRCGLRNALNRLGAGLAQLCLNCGGPGRMIVSTLPYIWLNACAFPSSVDGNRNHPHSDSGSDSDSDQLTNGSVASGADLPGVIDTSMIRLTHNLHSTWRRFSKKRLLMLCVGFVVFIGLSRHLWPEWTVLHRYSMRHRREVQITQQAIEEYMEQHPTIDCASSLEVHRSWHHVVVRMNAETMVSHPPATTLPADWSGAGTRGRWLTLINPEVQLCEAGQCDPNGNSEDNTSQIVNSRKVKKLGTYQNVDEVPTHCSFLAMPLHSAWRTAISWWSYTTGAAAKTAPGVPVYGDHDAGGYKTRTVNRHRHVRARVLDSDTWKLVDVTLHHTAAFCVQHYHDIFNGRWPCELQ